MHLLELLKREFRLGLGIIMLQITKGRNRLIIIVASIVIAFLIGVMVLVTIFSLDMDSSEGTKFLLMDIPLAFAIVMVFFIAKDRLR